MIKRELWYVEWYGGNKGTYEREGDDFYYRFKMGDRMYSGSIESAKIIRKATTDKGQG